MGKIFGKKDIISEYWRSAEVMTLNEALKKLGKDHAEYLVFRDHGQEGQPLRVAFVRDGEICGVSEIDKIGLG